MIILLSPLNNVWNMAGEEEKSIRFQRFEVEILNAHGGRSM